MPYRAVMSTQSSNISGRTAVDLYLITWTSGVMDALSYVRAHVFTANMTGNTVILGLAVVGTGRARFFDSLLAIATFAAGVLIAGAVLVRIRQPRSADDLRLGTCLETPFLILFAVLWAMFPSRGPYWVPAALISSAACALGIQSVAARRLKISGVVTTFITGTMSTTIVSLLERREPGAVTAKEAQTSPLLLAGMFFLYIGAALAGGVLAEIKSPLAGAGAAAPALLVLIRSLRRA